MKTLQVSNLIQDDLFLIIIFIFILFLSTAILKHTENTFKQNKIKNKKNMWRWQDRGGIGKFL